MSIPREAYQGLQAIVGPEWVSDDPAVCEADLQGGGQAAAKSTRIRPACSIQPETTEEVRAIVKLCNQYLLPFAATSSYNSPEPGSGRENVVFIDLKRMRKLEIDEENLYAVVEPGVSFVALQAEVFKRGLLAFVPMCGGNCSVVANTINIGEGALSWKLGDRGYRRLLAAEWVTADGELLRLGSRSMFNDFFWGEGPGPDLRGLMVVSDLISPAAKGVATKIGVRLFPFVSEKLVPSGDTPATTLLLPENRFKWYNLIFPTRKAAVDAMYEMGKCEIALLVMTVPPWFFSMARVRAPAPAPTGAAGFWANWNEKGGPRAAERPEQTVVRLLLYGIGADKRLAYEEKVVLDIAEEFGADARVSRAQDETHFMSSDAIVSNIAGGRFRSILNFESMDHGLKVADIINENTRRRTPPILNDYGTTNWLLPYDLAHTGKEESLRFTDVEHEEELFLLMEDCQKDFLETGAFPATPDPQLYGPAWGNFPEKNRKLKQLLDPNNLAYPLD